MSASKLRRIPHFGRDPVGKGHAPVGLSADLKPGVAAVEGRGREVESAGSLLVGEFFLTATFLPADFTPSDSATGFATAFFTAAFGVVTAFVLDLLSMAEASRLSGDLATALVLTALVSDTSVFFATVFFTGVSALAGGLSSKTFVAGFLAGALTIEALEAFLAADFDAATAGFFGELFFSTANSTSDLGAVARFITGLATFGTAFFSTGFWTTTAALVRVAMPTSQSDFSENRDDHSVNAHRPETKIRMHQKTC